MNKLRLAELTATEAREALAGNPVILLPMGSHEDQGLHAPGGRLHVGRRDRQADRRYAVEPPIRDRSDVVRWRTDPMPPNREPG